MNELLQMMLDYAYKHAIDGGVTLVLEEDGSGSLRRFDYDEDPFFYFDTPEELFEELKR